MKMIGDLDKNKFENMLKNILKPAGLISLIFFLLCAELYSQERMSLEQCRQLALENNKDIKISEKKIDQATATKQSMIANYFPKASAMGTVAYVFEDIKLIDNIEPFLPQFEIGQGALPEAITNAINKGLSDMRNGVISGWNPIEISLQGAYLAGIVLQQPVYAGGKILAGNKMAKIGMEMAAENNRLQQSNALFEADQTYWVYIAVGEKVKLAKQYMNLLDTLYIQVENAYNLQMAGKNDLLKVKVKKNQVSLELQRAESGHELARMALCRITGLELTTPIIATDTLVTIAQETVIPLNDTITNEVFNRPEYKLLQKNIDLNRQKIKLVTGDYLPMIGVGLSYAYAGGYRLQNVAQKAINLSNVMATMKIPILDWGEGSRKIKAAKIEKDISELELEKNRDLMKLEIEKNKMEMTNAATRISMAEEALEQSDENLKINKDQYEVGMETITNVLEAQAQWQQIYSELIEARADYKIKESAYLKSIGKL